MDNTNDHDYFKLTVTITGSYNIYTRGTTNTIGTLYNAIFGYLSYNDDSSGYDKNFRITNTLTPGTYYIEVTGYNSSFGPYQLVVEGSTVCAGNTVSGYAKDATTGRPLSGVQLSMEGNTTTSAADGHYSIQCVSTGLHFLSSSAPGYAGGVRGLNVCADTTVNAFLASNQTVFGLNAPSAYSADPVNTATGNYTFARTDLKLPGKGIGFSFDRGYNSLDPLNGPLGYGWTHSYNACHYTQLSRV